MKSACMNCNVIFDDGFERSVQIIYAIMPDEVGNISRKVYCDTCEKKLDQLMNLQKRVIIALNKEIENEFKEFGYELRKAGEQNVHDR